MNSILKRPLITEKAMNLSAEGIDKKQYVFEVDPAANKIQIKKAVEDMFEVKVLSVRTTRIKGKVKTRMTRRGMMRGKTRTIKKAYLTLKEGDTIELVSGVNNE